MIFAWLTAETMNQWIFVATMFTAVVLLANIVFKVVKSSLAKEWRLRRVYQIRGLPKEIRLGEYQIPITLRLGAPRYVGRGYVYFVKERSGGPIVSPDVASIRFGTDKANYVPGIRTKGEELALVLEISAKSLWKGWLMVGFSTEDNNIPYMHLPITTRGQVPTITPH